MDILEKIRQLKIERKWSEYQLAEKSGLPQSTISSWYRKGIQPSVVSLEAICNAFNISLAQFFCENNQFLDLTDNQQELLNSWGKLNKKQQELLLDFLKTI